MEQFTETISMNTIYILEAMKSEYLDELRSGMFFEWYTKLTGQCEKDGVVWYLLKHLRQFSLPRPPIDESQTP